MSLSAGVWSGRDPLVYAYHVTKGTLFFAQKQAEDKATGIMLLMFGCVLSIPAAVLGFPFISRYFRLRRDAAKFRKYSQVRSDGLLP